MCGGPKKKSLTTMASNVEIDSNKAPGTPHRAEGYRGPETENQNMFLRRTKQSPQQFMLSNKARGTAYAFKFLLFGFLAPMCAGVAYVNWQVGREWYDKTKDRTKSVWFRRNQRDYELYMTQRPNSRLELAGLKSYNIGGEDNVSDEVTDFEKKGVMDFSRLPGFVDKETATLSTVRGLKS